MKLKKLNYYDCVKWYINNCCNLNCPFCFVKGINNLSQTFEEKCKVLDKLYTDGVRNIDFFGKEPLFNHEIFDVMQYGKSKGYDFYYSFISNGKNLKKYTRELLQSPCRNFTISYDFHSGDRAYKFNLEDLLPFKGEFLIELSVDVHLNNTSLILEELNNIDDYGVTSLYFNPIIPFGSALDVISITEQEYENFIIDVLNAYKGNGVIQFKIPFQMHSLTQKYKEFGFPFITEPYCSAGIEHFCISDDGTAYGCVSQLSSGNNHNTCDYLSTPIDKVYGILSRHTKKRLCE